MSEISSPLLEVRGLVKDYPGVRAWAALISRSTAAKCIA
jgi:hypothetical protein